MMGQRLVKRGARPSLILTSPAKRARATVRLIARAMGYPIEFLQSEEALYLADPDRLLDVVATQDSSFNEIIVCAHNPGITELSNRLTGQNIDNVPTCGTVVIEADIVDWNELRGADCTLSYFDYPKRESD